MSGSLSTVPELEELSDRLAVLARRYDRRGPVARQLDEMRSVLASHVLAAFDLEEAGVSEARRQQLLDEARRHVADGLHRLRLQLQR